MLYSVRVFDLQGLYRTEPRLIITLNLSLYLHRMKTSGVYREFLGAESILLDDKGITKVHVELKVLHQMLGHLFSTTLKSFFVQVFHGMN